MKLNSFLSSDRFLRQSLSRAIGGLKLCSFNPERGDVVLAYMKCIRRLYTRKGSWTIKHGVEHETRVVL